MHKKSTRYLPTLIAMIAIAGLCWATPTPMTKRGASESPPFARQYNISNNTITTITDDDDLYSYPTGRLKYPIGQGYFKICTASVIDTPNGNIGITAAHCIFDSQGNMYGDITFSPGYNYGQEGPLGSMPIAKAKAPDRYQPGVSGVFDYALVRFAFNDPAGENNPLQVYTGAHGWQLGLETNIPTTVLGYPVGGNLPNCPNDGNHLCGYRGTAVLYNDNIYRMPGPDIGPGGSGGPWLWNYDINTNLGILFGEYCAYATSGNLASPLFDTNDWDALMNYVSSN